MRARVMFLRDKLIQRHIELDDALGLIEGRYHQYFNLQRYIKYKLIIDHHA